MSEDAVSPVIAAMLILAIAVTFFATWNAVYVPSMKARSEVTHLGEVESGFLRFSSDIDTAVSLKRNMRVSERIPLGGGDFTFDSLRSGGTIRIRNETEGYLRLTVLPAETSGTLVRTSAFMYEPVGNFWQDQGYEWSYGTVNVTKGSLSTPLQYADMDSVSYGLAESLFILEPVPSPDNPAACSVVNVYIVNISPSAGRTLSSGNGNGMLSLESRVGSRQYSNATGMTVAINPGAPAGFRDTLWESVNRSIVSVTEGCPNVHATMNRPNLEANVVFDTIPNMTLNRKATEISLATY